MEKYLIIYYIFLAFICYCIFGSSDPANIIKSDYFQQNNSSLHVKISPETPLKTEAEAAATLKKMPGLVFLVFIFYKSSVTCRILTMQYTLLKISFKL